MSEPESPPLPPAFESLPEVEPESSLIDESESPVIDESEPESEPLPDWFALSPAELEPLSSEPLSASGSAMPITPQA